MIATKKKKETTLDDLARMMANGFADMDKRFVEMDRKFDKKFELLVDDNRLIRADIHDIKNTLGPLVQVVGSHDYEFKKINQRLDRLEKFVGTGK